MTDKKKLLIIAAVTAAVILMFMPVRLVISAKGKIYENDRIAKGNITVKTSSLIGFAKELEPEKYDMKAYYYGDVDVVEASYMGIKSRRPILTIPVRNVSAEYTAKVYPGDKFSESNVVCSTEYADGTVRESFPVSVQRNNSRFTDVSENIVVMTKNGPATARVNPIPPIYITTDQEVPLYQYDVPDFYSIKFIYADGSSRVLSKEDVTFGKDVDDPVEDLGKNRFCFTYHGIPYVVSMTAKENTNVTNAIRENKSEMKNAEYLYVSDTLYIAVNQISDSLGYYYVSHVVVNDPSQIVSALSYDTWGGKREKPSSAANRLGMILAANGSYFSYDTNTPRCAEVFIKHGKVYSDEYEDENGEQVTRTDGKELCLLKDGTLWTPEEGLTAKDLLNKGVTDVWGAGDPLLIQEGKLYPTHHDWVNGKYPRTGIGMVKPCEYYLLTAGSGGYRGGLTFDDVQYIFKKLNCSYARTLDGGGSSTLVFNDGDGAEVINNPAGNVERPVPDFIGFCN